MPKKIERPYGKKISDFGLSALSHQAREDGLLHTSCGTQNYVAPEVLSYDGYDGAAADLWSCGVILYVLLSGSLPFDDSDLIILYEEISNAEFSCPPWFSAGAENLLKRILDPNPMTRITIAKILKDKWFKKGYKRPAFDDKYNTNLDDVAASFKDSEDSAAPDVEDDKPATMNAFELISLMSKGMDLGRLFETKQEFKTEMKFTSKYSAKEITSKIEEAAKPLGFDIQKKNYKTRLRNSTEGRKGTLNVATEIRQVAPSFHMMFCKKRRRSLMKTNSTK